MVDKSIARANNEAARLLKAIRTNVFEKPDMGLLWWIFAMTATFSFTLSLIVLRGW